MHPALSAHYPYLLPAIFLNPVLFLHGLNTILSRIIPPVVVAGPIQPPPYSTLGPSANHPHLDVHASENFCWSYTLVMLCAQLMAFVRVHRLTEEGKEKRRLKTELAKNGRFEAADQPFKLANGHAISQSTTMKPRTGTNGSVRKRGSSFHPASSEDSKINGSCTKRYSPDTSEDRAPTQPSVENTESSASSLVDVDSPHISSVPSDFESQATQTKTQAERMAHEAEDQAREASSKASQKTKETSAEADKIASEASSKVSGKAKEFGQFASEKGDELSKEASDKYDKAKKSTARNYREGKEEAREKGNELSRNRDNPVVVGNAVIIGVGSVALGFNAYQKYAQGELSWKLAGITAAAVGAFAVGDYYLSQYLFQNKYPKK
ncbi:MAG: hypothetical protein Q9216_003108 [Gyalolechia sp. 2 TL-2023]